MQELISVGEALSKLYGQEYVKVYKLLWHFASHLQNTVSVNIHETLKAQTKLK